MRNEVRTMRVIKHKRVRMEDTAAMAEENRKITKEIAPHSDCARWGCKKCVACGHCTEMRIRECNRELKKPSAYVEAEL